MDGRGGRLTRITEPPYIRRILLVVSTPILATLHFPILNFSKRVLFAELPKQSKNYAAKG